MATASGNKVRIRKKRRQNDNEEQKPKKIRRVTKKESKRIRSFTNGSSKGNENDIKKLIPERNDSSACVYSELPSLQIFSAVTDVTPKRSRLAPGSMVPPRVPLSSRRQLLVVSSKLFYDASRNTQRSRQ